MASTSEPPPETILILGSGVFGLSTAWALTQNAHFDSSKIQLIDRAPFPAQDGSSVDSSRIIRADYADAAYSRLAGAASERWRGDWGAEGRYTETGLAIFDGCVATDEGQNCDDDDAEAIASREQAEKYTRKAMQNVIEGLGLRVGKKEDGGQATPIIDEASAREAMGTAGGLVGTRGYVNWTSGWAHAEEGVKYLRRKVEATGRVDFRTAEVERLLFAQDRADVCGAIIKGGEEIHADLVILATGAWTPKFIDLRGIACATGQVLAYLNLTEDEQDHLSKNPVFIDYESGMFIIPPLERKLKVARHGYGYANPTNIPHPEKSDETITVSLPFTKWDDPDLVVPTEGLDACRAFLKTTIPSLADRPFTSSRICWYCDTPKADWLICYHPRYPSLFVATGGSGHGYKFLPVLGERIVDVVLQVDRDDLGKTLRQKWAWPTSAPSTDHISLVDRRGGRRGMILQEELAKTNGLENRNSH